MSKNIVVIGGGTGTVAVLSGLKQHDDLNISVIVGMTDDGGSNRIVRDEFGLLPLSDLRKSIVALSDNGNGILREMFTYRFDKGEGLSSHTLGNLMLMALSDITGSEVGAIEAASKLFNCKGSVLPVTLDDVRLVAEYDDGRTVTGEHLIDEPVENPDARITLLKLSEPAQATDAAVKAILEADFVIAGPGDLYTSTLANIIVDRIPQALQESKGKYIFISNLMTKKGQTHWMKASDLLAEISRYSGRTPDIILLNNGDIPEATLARYAKKGEYMIEDDITDGDATAIRSDIVSNDVIQEEAGDTLVRSLVRHDGDELASVLYSIFTQ
ncbi:MAG: Gluconeogenesis factor [candidate division WS6 bacterium OLB20]|uniref:Putative gluconeogenesis factor n=1 Tax=candidate division WS6 bacterium OLB20 TaxID=1617426 RepID=A0A136LXX5_9BACT|nr:MAG: Gluconeogenesis factor [candidate division WS6 bacterium OLB20]